MSESPFRGYHVLFFIVCILAITGCTTPRKPLPDGTGFQATMLGFDKDIRCFLSMEQGELEDELLPLMDGLDLAGGSDGEFNLLQLSGGGEYGAFGAGILNGWSASGKRPEFDMVTGISTGALSAPMAFLGEDYDVTLKRCYTEISAWDVFGLRGLKSLFVMPTSVVSSKPLQELIANIIDDEMLEAIANEHQKGRRLFVATTYLDEQKFVVWDIGAIACSGEATSLELVHQILLASAAIPMAFPPVMFDVVFNDESYDEMHVDGSVFSSTVGVELFQLDTLEMMTPKRNVFYVINWPIASVHQPVDRSIMDIGYNSVSTMLKNAHRWDLFRTYVTANLADFDFNYHKVPDSFPIKEGMPFDQDYMNRLYNRGYELGSDPESWEDLNLLLRE